MKYLMAGTLLLATPAVAQLSVEEITHGMEILYEGECFIPPLAHFGECEIATKNGNYFVGTIKDGKLQTINILMGHGEIVTIWTKGEDS